MLLIVSPNIGIDRILEVPDFAAAKVQRSTGMMIHPGGKGSHVSRVFRHLGGEVALTGFIGRHNPHLAIHPLNAIGINVDAVSAFDGDCRTCTIILDTKGAVHPTVINEESPEIEAGAEQELLKTIEKWLPQVNAVLCIGSLASGLAPDFYFRVLTLAKTHGALTMLDAAGEALRHGLHAGPDILKVNAEEFAPMADGTAQDPESVVRRLKNLKAPIAAQTIVTFGTRGAILAAGTDVWSAVPPVIAHANPIGCGDAFAAGYIHEYLKTREVLSAFRVALACAASDAGTPRPGVIDIGQIPALVAAVNPTRAIL